MTPKISRFALTNNGAFRAEMYISYTVDGSTNTTHHSESIRMGDTFLTSPKTLGVPDHAYVTMAVDVVPSHGDKVASNTYLFDSESSMCAYYTISGNVFVKNLKLDRIDIPEWRNWSHNIVYLPPDRSYFYPHNKEELSDIVRRAAASNLKIRVTGQRHSQSPLVTTNARNAQPHPTSTILVDMACYRDLGPDGMQGMYLEGNYLSVNAGMREDQIDAFLTSKNKILKTATAGGFFSVGGMTSVDVHGATVKEGIFSDTATAFHIMGPDGEVSVINEETPVLCGSKFRPIQFARVNVGALGVVTRITLSVQNRPYADSLIPDKEEFRVTDAPTFAAKVLPLLQANDRVEVFLDPYDGDALALMWSVKESGETPNEAPVTTTACIDAGKNQFGAPYLGALEGVTEELAQVIQDGGHALAAKVVVGTAMKTIKSMFRDSLEEKSDLWLKKAARTMFMSYFVPLPGLDDAGLRFAWRGIQAVIDRLDENSEFFLAAPIEFRIVSAGDSVLAGTYTDPASTVKYYINLDMIAFADGVESKEYPSNLQRFFKDIEEVWFEQMGGLPHNGKMFGFFNPDSPAATPSGAFNPIFMKHLANLRKERLSAFDAFRKSRDPAGMFCNDHVLELLGTCH